jgi:hypothetical protein
MCVCCVRVRRGHCELFVKKHAEAEAWELSKDVGKSGCVLRSFHDSNSL